MKKTKWADHKFTRQERDARAKWRRADGQRSQIVNALMSCDHYMSRGDMHKRLDRRLDVIEKTQASARELFPEVGESFTIASMTISV